MVAVIIGRPRADFLRIDVGGRAHPEATDFDDAYMFVRYADNVLAGRGLVWNPVYWAPLVRTVGAMGYALMPIQT